MLLWQQNYAQTNTVPYGDTNTEYDFQYIKSLIHVSLQELPTSETSVQVCFHDVSYLGVGCTRRFALQL
jgi:hypothetical protein